MGECPALFADLENVESAGELGNVEAVRSCGECAGNFLDAFARGRVEENVRAFLQGEVQSILPNGNVECSRLGGCRYLSGNVFPAGHGFQFKNAVIGEILFPNIIGSLVQKSRAPGVIPRHPERPDGSIRVHAVHVGNRSVFR